MEIQLCETWALFMKSPLAGEERLEHKCLLAPWPFCVLPGLLEKGEETRSQSSMALAQGEGL